jgi:hypothetical protein
MELSAYLLERSCLCILQSPAICISDGRSCLCLYQRWARATFFRVNYRNSATWRKNFCNRNSATFKQMMLRNHNSAIPQSQFFLKSATSSPQLEGFTSAISDIFLAAEWLVDKYLFFPQDFRPQFISWTLPVCGYESGIRLIHEKKIGGKKSHATVPLKQVFSFHTNRQF